MFAMLARKKTAQQAVSDSYTLSKTRAQSTESLTSSCGFDYYHQKYSQSGTVWEADKDVGERT